MSSLCALLVLAVVAYAADIFVSVGGPEMMFEPADISASVGDLVHFNFTIDSLGSVGNHTVTQVSYAAPCTALPGGFSSPQRYFDFAVFTIEITSSDPIWFACATSGADPLDDHCQLGEVGSINAPPFGVQTFGGFASAARDTHPGGFSNLPTNGSEPGSGVGARVVMNSFGLPTLPTSGTTDGATGPTSATDNLGPAGTAASDTSSPTAEPAAHPGLASGAVAGIAAAAVAGVLLALLGACRASRARAARQRARGEWIRRLETSLRRGREKDMELETRGWKPEVNMPV